MPHLLIVVIQTFPMGAELFQAGFVDVVDPKKPRARQLAQQSPLLIFVHISTDSYSDLHAPPPLKPNAVDKLTH